MSNSILVSTRKGLIVYKQKGGQYIFDALHFKGIPISLSYYNPADGNLWAFQDHGHWGVKMSVSKDKGQNWEEVPAPVFPEGEEVKDGVEATLRYVWAINNGGNGNGGRMWMGTDPGGLFRSDDGGMTFALNRPLWERPERKTQWFGGGRDLPGIHSIVLDPRDSDHLYIGISCAGVYESRDAGKSWEARNKGLRADFLPDPHSEYGHDPHLLVASKNNPDYMWQQNHCGIFRSTDGAKSWQDVSEAEGPAKFGFAVAVDDDNPDLAFVVPALSDEIRVAVGQDLMVCRTEDGGKTWQQLSKGLPSENAFDIVYRHALDKSGQELVFGSTTGNLFYSNDGGDSWQVLSNYLPMVYAVDFVEM